MHGVLNTSTARDGILQSRGQQLNGKKVTVVTSFEALGEEIGSGISVIVVDAEPGAGPALHRHRYAETFVVLDGQATFTLGAQERVVHAGEIAVAPAGVAHRFVNSGAGRLRQVDIHEHSRFETEWL